MAVVEKPAGVAGEIQGARNISVFLKRRTPRD